MTRTANFIKDHFWGLSTIVFGIWETISFATGRKRIPTVSTTYCLARRKYGAPVTLAFASWFVGLFIHLWRHEVDG